MRHQCERRRCVAGFVALILLVCGAWLAPPAEATLIPQGLDNLVAGADDVVYVTCKSHDSKWYNGNIITTYQLEVVEALVGDRAVGASVKLSQPGGRSPGPIPVAQAVSELPMIRQDEAMVLFLRGPKRAASATVGATSATTPLDTTPVVIGGLQGKWTVSGQGALAARVQQPMPLLAATADGGKRLVRKKAPPRRYEDLRREIVVLAGAKANAKAALAAGVTIPQP